MPGRPVAATASSVSGEGRRPPWPRAALSFAARGGERPEVATLTFWMSAFWMSAFWMSAFWMSAFSGWSIGKPEVDPTWGGERTDRRRVDQNQVSPDGSAASLAFPRRAYRPWDAR
jgi:hypothetical protein